MMTRQLIALAAALCAGLTMTPSAHALYNVNPIATGYTKLTGINNAGQVIGTANDWSAGFVTGPNGIGMFTLGPPPDPSSWNIVRPNGINDLGQVVGMQNFSKAFVADTNTTTFTVLGGDWFWSSANGINNSGQIAGEGSINNSVRAFVTDSAGTMQPLSTPGWSGSGANGINNSGQVAGYVDSAAGNRRAFLADASGAITVIPTLGGLNSNAYAINDNGFVVGNSDTSIGFNHAFIYDPTYKDPVTLDVIGKVTDLGSLGRGDGATYNSEAFGINLSGQVVGWSAYPSTPSGHAFLWTPGDAKVIDLNTLIDLASLGGDFLSGAYGINDSGQIIASSWWGGAYLLTPDTPAAARFSMAMLAAPVLTAPVPEPETYALMLLGLSMVGWFARRRGVSR